MSDPRDELRLLTHALRRHVRRRSTLGERRLPRWTPAVPGTPPSERAPSERAPSERATSERAPSERATSAETTAAEPAPVLTDREGAGRQRDPADVAPARAQAPFPGTWGSTPQEKAETEARVSRLTQLAEECPDLPSLQALLANCNACTLCQNRTQTVFMDGDGPARVMFVGEAPGFHEDQQGTPFVGRAGQLLTDIIEKGMGLARREVVIANVLKCRPPDNRDPLPAEKRLCTTWLDRQIELVQPEMLIALGRHAAGHLLGTDSSMARLRGQIWQRGGRKVIATYHPAYLLRSPSEKKECWKDIRLAMAELGLDPPGNRPAAGR